MSGFEKHMADVLRNHEVAPPAGLEAQVFAALDGAGASVSRSAMRRRLGVAGLGAFLLAGLGWSIHTMKPDGSVVPVEAEAAHVEVLAPAAAAVEVLVSASPFEEVVAEELAVAEAPVVAANSEDLATEKPMVTATTAEPVNLKPLEQISTPDLASGTHAASDKSLQEVSVERRDGVWRMNARVNVKED